MGDIFGGGSPVSESIGAPSSPLAAFQTGAMGAGAATETLNKWAPNLMQATGQAPLTREQHASAVGVGEKAAQPNFWKSFSRSIGDFFEGAAEGVGETVEGLTGLGGYQMGPSAHSYSPVGRLPDIFRSGGLSALAQAIAGRR